MCSVNRETESTRVSSVKGRVKDRTNTTVPESGHAMERTGVADLAVVNRATADDRG